ncbi:dTDP-4-dehydrorhamnose 3,5-epimerase [Salinibacterium sp. G-O1]|uniref:dTDP-4-dehydrorhamnose 3,5-epimerase family protein n=1 Tax=Salinibacterium sp. G-O1 TaxID=3046208 RepID=UPI0024B9DF1E|nr:dTDP-4-dehydrorhamnose 3,5-epimerase [Salinibacterium sp. G-O1]MDJ0336512.1 dTDP-4-dehydrorhamnose 3,5-epimerase [Salinibacterium sp. G-O1]
MQIRPLSISGAFEFTPVIRGDERGAFVETYRFEALEEAAGHPLNLRQANLSTSAKAVARGIHYALVPPGQAKYVSAPYGAFIDFIVDIRVGSPTFGQWDSVIIDDKDRRMVYLAEGLGHAIVALTPGATVSYLVSEVYNPERELSLNLLDPEIGLVFPFDPDALLTSARDTEAPTLAEAGELGLLPRWDECNAYYTSLENGI